VVLAHWHDVIASQRFIAHYFGRNSATLVVVYIQGIPNVQILQLVEHQPTRQPDNLGQRQPVGSYR
jgi:hypothetical protein